MGRGALARGLWLLALAAAVTMGHAADTRSLAERLSALERSEVKNEEREALLSAIGAQLPAGESAERHRYERLRCMEPTDAMGRDSKQVHRYAERQLARAVARQDKPAQVDYLLCRGFSFYVQGQNDQALADYSAGLTLATALGDRRLQVSAYSFRGELRTFLGDYAQGLLDLQQAVVLSEREGIPNAGRYNLRLIGAVFLKLEDFDKAERYFQHLLKDYTAIGEHSYAALARRELGNVAEARGEYAKALEIFKKAQREYQTLGDTEAAVYVNRAIAACLIGLGRHHEALEAIAKLRTYAQGINDTEMLARLMVLEGQALLGLNRGADALAVLDKALALDNTQTNPKRQSEVLESRTLVLASQQRWRDAYETGKRYAALHLNADRELRERGATRLRIQFDSERTEAENRRLSREAGLKSEALAALEATRRWQAAALSLGLVVVLVLALLALRQIRRSRRLAVLAMTDELTQIANRRQIELLGREALAAYERSGDAFSVVVFDIDHFKRINDRYGHAVGDAVLRQVSAAAAKVLRGLDRIGRIGGEEFLVVLPGAHWEQALQIAERLRLAVAALHCPELEEGAQVTVSLGIAEACQSDGTLPTLIARADAALYRAKQQGRNRAEFADRVVITPG